MFRVGDTVFVKNFGAGRRWLLGQIIEITGPVSFHVLLEDGRPKRCHQDQLRSRVVDERDPPDTSQGDPDPSFPISAPTSSKETPPATQDAGPPEPPQQTDLSTSPSSDSNTNDRSTDRPTLSATTAKTKGMVRTWNWLRTVGSIFWCVILSMHLHHSFYVFLYCFPDALLNEMYIVCIA